MGTETRQILTKQNTQCLCSRNKTNCRGPARNSNASFIRLCREQAVLDNRTIQIHDACSSQGPNIPDLASRWKSFSLCHSGTDQTYKERCLSLAFDFCNSQVCLAQPFLRFKGRSPTILHAPFKICQEVSYVTWRSNLVSVLSCTPKHTHLRQGLSCPSCIQTCDAPAQPLRVPELQVCTTMLSSAQLS